MAEVLQVNPIKSSPSHAQLVARYQEDPITELARRIALDYVAYRLREKNAQTKLKGLPREFLIPPSHISDLCDTVRKMCYQMEDNNKVFFNSVVRKLQLDRMTAKKIYFEVMTAVFEEGINWGRVLTLFSFTAVYAQHFLQSNDFDLIPELIDWAALCVDNLLKDWIREQGGWDQLIEHFSRNQTGKRWLDAFALGGLFALASLAVVLKGR